MSKQERFKIKPEKAPIIYKRRVIIKFCLNDLFLLNKSNIPTPAEQESPDISEPKVMAPERKLHVSKTEAAQFGIRPISAAING